MKTMFKIKRMEACQIIKLFGNVKNFKKACQYVKASYDIGINPLPLIRNRFNITVGFLSEKRNTNDTDTIYFDIDGNFYMDMNEYQQVFYN